MTDQSDLCDPTVYVSYLDETTWDEDGVEDTCDDYTYTVTRTWKAVDS